MRDGLLSRRGVDRSQGKYAVRHLPGRNNAGASPASRESLSLQTVAAFPLWEGIYYLVSGTPPPPFACKIQKTNDLFLHYVLDL
jgi:hypothetical protein